MHAIAEPEVGSDLCGASGVHGVVVDSDDDAIDVDRAGDPQRRVPESRAEVEGASHACRASKRSNQVHLRSAGVMEPAAVASLVDLALGTYLGEPIPAGEFHELHRYVAAHRPCVTSPSGCIPLHIRTPNPLDHSSGPAAVPEPDLFSHFGDGADRNL